MSAAGECGRILEPMVRRLATLVLAFVLAATPTALAACEWLCASRAHEVAATTAGHVNHLCHESNTAVTLSIDAGVHNCGHSAGLPTPSATQAPQDAPSPAVEAIPAILAVLGPLVSLEPRVIGSPPSDALRLITQLRI